MSATDDEYSLPQDPFVSWQGVSVSLGDRWALREVDLDVRGTDFVAILGPNGAGKSTLLRAMAGLIPSVGGAKAMYRPVSGLSGSERRKFFAYLAQDREIS